MIEKRKIIISFAIFLNCVCFSFKSFSQKTQIRGFMDLSTSLEDNKVSFGFGEQDLFITSELSDRFSFLGESVFKFTPSTPTTFSVSIERVIVKYNFSGNHNLLIGKHHTPINYWNDTYHHGRVFFPTIFRPLMFEYDIIPLHTTGVSLQGQNLGQLKFGYDLMIGNGLGSQDVLDNDKRKSITAAVHIKPAQGLRIGFSWYNDVMSAGSKTHGGKLINWDVRQNLFSPSIAYFGDKVEVLAESTIGTNHTDTTGTKQTFAGYIYAGYKIKERIVPYVRFDRLHFQEGEILFDKNNTTSIVGGIRYNINYLTVVKLEYQHEETELEKDTNKLMFQIAIGF
jgi:hypothetical protein